MAIKKSNLYSSLWASCDELRGSMDASQYKDYVLFMLFIKYISDKYGDSDDFAPPVVIPKGASFKDMVALKGNSDIGNKINTQVIQPLIDANSRLARSDFPDFNDSNKLGEGPAKVERLSNLVAIFQKPELDFSKNRAEHDDILGDAYEYLMRHFASESGKSKGQFYTPAEVSRIMAKAIGISHADTKASTTAYDPTCGSGSLLLKVAAEAGRRITLEGQEKDVTTAGLARMNMILHDFPTANILHGNTLSDPKFKDGEKLRTYDYVVANPPFSDKTWSTGLTLGESGKGDPFQRFSWGVPPKKQGDYAYLLHIIRSMRSTGKGACILPHGVLFRGNAEAVIRQQLILSGYLKAIIGLPANLFYGTGIPACILILDKENAMARKGIFMVDASKGFMKDGPKNRLREQIFTVSLIPSSARLKATAPPFNPEIPKPPADFTPDRENARFAVAKKFVELVKQSAQNGKTPTLVNILVRWVQLGGVARQSDLATAAGLQRNVSFRGAASVLQRHMNSAGGPKSTYDREMLKFQTAWYQRTDEIDGSAILTMEPEFFLYLHHRPMPSCPINARPTVKGKR